MAPILTDHTFDVITHSAQQTLCVGALLGRLLRAGDVVCLQGDLGSGKTCLTQGIGTGMRVVGVICSPTFVFVNEYKPSQTGPYLYHVDLYRIEDESAAYALGLEDYMYGDGVTVIEWAERTRDILPHNRLWVTLAYVDVAKRSLRFEASGERYRELVLALRSQVLGLKPDRHEQAKEGGAHAARD